MIGGDLAAMASLASRFQAAGAEFSAQSASIAAKVRLALDSFVTEMSALNGEAKTLAESIDGRMATLNNQASATVWTGANRIRQDDVVGSLVTEVAEIRGAIDGFADTASQVVNGKLTASMTDLEAGATMYGNAALSTASGFGVSVTGQRNAFDAVMNG